MVDIYCSKNLKSTYFSYLLNIVSINIAACSRYYIDMVSESNK